MQGYFLLLSARLKDRLALDVITLLLHSVYKGFEKMESGLTVKWHDRMHPSQKHFDYMKELGVQDGLVSPSMSSFTSDVLKVGEIFFLFNSVLLTFVDMQAFQGRNYLIFLHKFVMRTVGIDNFMINTDILICHSNDWH